MSELTATFDSLETGDKIIVPQYENPLTVVDVHDSVGVVELEGQRGGEKSLVQNKHNAEQISLMAGADKKGVVDEIDVVNTQTEDSDNDDGEDASGLETETYEQPDGTPKKTGRTLAESVPTVRIDETPAPNPRVVIHVEHPDHDGGVRSFYRRADSDVAASVRSHLETEIQSAIARVELVDTAGLGLTESDIVPGCETGRGDVPVAIADGGTEEIRSRSDIEHTDDAVRTYHTDGTLYAYREDGKHVVVSRGDEPAARWTKRVPAERTAVAVGEQLWTVPDNWEQQVTVKETDVSRSAIYRIPETGVDVLVSVPHKNHLVDAWYGVKSVGELAVTYDDSCDWDALEETIEQVRDVDEVSDDAVDALETLSRRRETFERKFAEGVNMCAEDVLFEGYGPGTPSLEGWTVDPWRDSFMSDRRLLEDLLDVDDETLAEVDQELGHANVVPSYPYVRVSVEDREGLPEGYDVRALTQAGCSASEALDYYMVEIKGLTQTAWADERGVDQSTVSGNVSAARRELKA